MCNLEINIPCSAIEDCLQLEHRFESEVKIIGAELDTMGDIIALQLVVDDCDINKFRHNSPDDLAEGLIENII
jgi:hypothetical protein